MKHLFILVILAGLSSCRTWCEARYFEEHTIHDTVHVIDTQYTEPVHKIERMPLRDFLRNRKPWIIETDRGYAKLSLDISKEPGNEVINLEFFSPKDTLIVNAFRPVAYRVTKPNCPDPPPGINVPRWLFFTGISILILLLLWFAFSLVVLHWIRINHFRI